MKTMKDFAAQQLTKKQMNAVTGGVDASRVDYCKKLYMIYENAFQSQIKGEPSEWTSEDFAHADALINQHCIPYGIRA